jgi:hypothetical protein
MYFRSVVCVLFAALLLLSGSGCQKAAPGSVAALPTVQPPDTIASVHWLGKRQLGYEATAYFLMRVWNLPQSAQLERQTLLKLAGSPGLWLPGGTNLNVDASSRLWWALNDLLQEESYVEIQAPSNAPASLAFAIRLNEAQADQWRTNLPVILEPLLHSRAVLQPDGNGWSLPTADPNQTIQLARAGHWTLVGFGPQPNRVLATLAERIGRDGVPFVSAGTNLWFEADLQPSRLAVAFPTLNSQLSTLNRFKTLNHLAFSLSGDGANVITHARVTLDHALPTDLEPWHLPMNLLHEPLTSLTAVRGVSSWLAEWPVWHDLSAGAAPDQFCLWSLDDNPYQVYLAAPWPAADVSRLTQNLVQKENPWLAANNYISFDRTPAGDGVTWGNLPDIKPFIRSVTTGSDSWLYAGLFPDTNTAALPPPSGLIQDILRRTNLVYYDWEVTGPRLQPALQVMQTARLITHHPQLSLQSASLQWLGSIIPRLGTSATIVTRTGPDELTVLRRSTLGLTAVELHLLTGWLESPNFPR